MDLSDITGAALLIAFTVVRGAFLVGMIAAIVVVVRAVLRPPTHGGEATAVALAPGRPDKGA
jgi:hypothetical protein